MSVPCTFLIMCNVPSVWYSCLSPVHSLLCVMFHQCDIPVPVPVPCTFLTSVIFIYKCTQNEFSVRMYTKPVYSTHVCAQNLFTVQVYRNSLQYIHILHVKLQKSNSFKFFYFNLHCLQRLYLSSNTLTSLTSSCYKKGPKLRSICLIINDHPVIRW